MSDYLIQREDHFDFRSAEYADLYRDSDATAFQHPVWISGIYEELAPRLGARKVVVTARADHGRLVGVLPFVHRRQWGTRVLEFADLGVNDYAAPILAPSFAAELSDNNQIARQIRRALGPFDLLRVERVPDTPDLMCSLLHRSKPKKHTYAAHLITLHPTHEQWRDSLDPKFARHLDRKYKRLRPKGERRLRTIEDPADADEAMKRMQQFRHARFAERRGTDLVQHPAYFDFYSSVARRGFTDGPSRLVVLEVGGETAAVALDLLERDRELFLLVGYDMERLRNYSIGLLIVDELIRCAIGEGATAFDLTVGDEDYKADFGARSRPLYEIQVTGTSRGCAHLLARSGYLAARRLAKKVVLALEVHQKRRKQVG